MRLVRRISLFFRHRTPRWESDVPVCVVPVEKKYNSASHFQKIALTLFALVSSVYLLPRPVLAAPDVNALPLGGNVSLGQATISSSNGLMQINQTSNKTAIDWASFNIGSNASVVFNQPSAQAVALNRILSLDPSQIYGRLSANGQLILVNPNGVVFGPGSQVNAAAMIVSTMGLSNSDFLAGNYRFLQDQGAQSSTAALFNQGSIQVEHGGFVALIGHNLQNVGSIVAPGGTVGMLAGDMAEIDLNHTVPQFTVSAAALGNATIENSGTITAAGGVIQLNARNLDPYIGTANSLSNQIIINQNGLLSTSSNLNGGTIAIDGGEVGIVQTSGHLLANSADANGGSVKLLGEKIGLLSASKIDVSGALGGGTVLVGGNWQGQDVEPHARAVYMDANAAIKADALNNGHGGKVVLWSDDYTNFHGSISARGGINGGNGGQVETSGHHNLQVSGFVDTAAPKGKRGQWLLDPVDVTIANGGTSMGTSPYSPLSNSTINASSIVTALLTGDVTINTSQGTGGNGDININESIISNSGVSATLTFNAYRNLILNNNIAITSTGSPLNVIMNAAMGASGYIDLRSGSSITTNGGKIDVLAGATSITSGVGINGATLSSNGGNIRISNTPFDAVRFSNSSALGAGANSFNSSEGVWIQGAANINAGGGNIMISGKGGATYGIGVEVSNSSRIQTINTGSINITGDSGTLGSTYGTGFYSGGSGLTISTELGAINIWGTTRIIGSTATAGIWILPTAGNIAKIYSTGSAGVADINLYGYAPVSGAGLYDGIHMQTQGTTYVGWDGVSTVTSANIGLHSEDNGNNNATNIDAISLKTFGGALTLDSAALRADGVTAGRGMAAYRWNTGTIANGTVLSNLKIGDANTYGTQTLNQTLGCANQAVTACSGVTLGTGSGGTGSNFVGAPVSISLGATYNNAAASVGGILAIGGSITTVNQPISLLAGGAVAGANSLAKGSISLSSGVNLSSAGGNITIANGSGGDPSGAMRSDAIYMTNNSVDAGGGNITLTGFSTAHIGVEVDPSSFFTTTGTGNISITGYGATFGMSFNGSTLTAGGKINLSGSTNGSSSDSNEAGISFWSGTTNITSSAVGAQAITLTAIDTSTNRRAINSGAGTTNNGLVNLIALNAGDITILGQDGGTNMGVDLGGMTVKTNGGYVTIGAVPFTAGVAGTSASTGLGLGSMNLRNGLIANGAVLSGLSIGGANNYGTITMNQVLGCANQAVTACAGVTMGTGSGGTGSNFVGAPVTIQAGGLFASGTNTIASPAALSAYSGGGLVYVAGAITTVNQPITLSAGQAVPYISGQTTSYSTTALGLVNVMSSLLSGGGNILISNMNPVTGAGFTTSTSVRSVSIGVTPVGILNPQMLTIDATNTALNTGGNIQISGIGSGWNGIEINNATISTLGSSGVGTININGISTSNNNLSDAGINFGNSLGSTTALITTGGAITVKGTTSGSAGSGGIATWTGNVAMYSTSGNITLMGISSSSSVPAIKISGSNLYIGYNGSGAGTTGNITIQGQDAGNNAGFNLGNTFLKTNGGAVTIGAIPFAAGVAGTSASTGLGLGSFTFNNGLIVNGSVLSGLSIGGLNSYGTITMNQVLGCANQAVTACASGVTMGTGSGGTGSNFVGIPLTIQVGGMVASGTNTIASPAALSAYSGGGNLSITGAITTVGKAIALYAGNGAGTFATSTAQGSIDVSANLTSNGGDITIANSNLGGTTGLAAGMGVRLRNSAIVDARDLISSIGGSILLNGFGATNAGGGNAMGVEFNGATVRTNGNGTLTINGTATISTTSSSAAVAMTLPTTLSTEMGALTINGSGYTATSAIRGGIYLGNAVSISSTTGDIFLDGRSSTFSPGIYSTGSGTKVIYSNTGKVSLIGHSLGSNTDCALCLDSPISIGWNGVSGGGGIVTTNDIVLKGEDTGSPGTMRLDGVSLKTNGGAVTIGSSGKGLSGFTVNSIFANGTVLSGLTIGDANIYGTLTVNQVFGCANQATTACTGVTLGTGSGTGNFVGAPVNILAGGTYNNAAHSSGGMIVLGGSITTVNQVINLLAGGAVAGANSLAKGSISLNSGVNLSSAGGNITLANGVGGTPTGAVNNDAVFLTNNTVNAGGGNIVLTGLAAARIGVELNPGSLTTTGSGNISLTGVGATFGVIFNSSTLNAGGKISISGTATSSGGDNNEGGISFWNGTTNITSAAVGAQAITLIGINNATNRRAINTGSTTSNNGQLRLTASNAGDITIWGQDAGTNMGMETDGIIVQTNGGYLTVGALPFTAGVAGTSASTGLGLGSYTLRNGFVASGTVLSGLSIGGLNNYGAIQIGQSFGGGSGVALGNGTTIPYPSVLITAGGMYASGTNTIASPAALSVNSLGGAVGLGIPNVTGMSITTNNQPISVLVGGAVSGSTARGSIRVQSSNLFSNGGDITLANGSAGDASYLTSTAVYLFSSVALNAAGGNISLTGTSTSAYGVFLDTNVALATVGAGAIQITGKGVDLGIPVGTGTNTISTVNGAITMSGTASGNSSAIAFYAGTNLVYSNTGAITLRGVITGSGTALSATGGATYIGWNNGSTVTTGNITLQGQDSGGNAGMNFSNMFVKTNGGSLTVGAIPFTAGVAGTSASTGLGVGTFALNNGFIANGTVLSGLSIGGLNSYGTITVNQTLGCANQAVTACASGVTMGTGSGGTGSNFVAIPAIIQAGGMYASGTNTIASPAALSASGIGGNITTGNSITTVGQNITISAGGAVAGSNATGSANIQSGTLSSGGGNIAIANGSAGANAIIQGVNLSSVTVDATGSTVGGNITINGSGYNNSTNTARGVQIYASTIKTNGLGTLTINAYSGDTGTTSGVNEEAGLLLHGGVTLSSAAGAINVVGRINGRSDDARIGLWFYDSTTRIYSTSGDITLTGILDKGSSAVTTSGTAYVGWDGGSNVTSGNIKIYGQDNGANAGMYLGNMFVKTIATNASNGSLTVGALPFTAGVAGTSASTGLGLGSFTLSNGFVASGTVLSNLTIGGLNNYGAIQIGQSFGGSSGVALGNGTTIPYFPILITAGGMYASGTNTIASPAALSANSLGGFVGLGIPNVTGMSITTNNQPISVLVGNAVSGSTATGSIRDQSSNLSSGGGDITLANGSAGQASSYLSQGIYLYNSLAINAGGGNVFLNGTSFTSHGVHIDTNVTLSTIGSGRIQILGRGADWGIPIGAGTNTISTDTGAIDIIATNSGGNPAVGFYAGTNYVYSNQGSITLRGTETGSGNAIGGGNVAYIGWNNGSTVTTGNITLQGQDSGGNAGMNFSNMFVKTNGGSLTVGAIPFTAGVAGTSASTGLGVGSFTLSSGFIANGTVLSGLSIGGLNNYGTINMNQALGCANQAVTACASGVTMGTGSGGTGSNFVAIPGIIQIGGMYASGTNTVASPAALSANGNGGNVFVRGAISTVAQPIKVIAGSAVLGSTAIGSAYINANLISGGGDITIGNGTTGANVFVATAGATLDTAMIDATSVLPNMGGNISITGTGGIGNTSTYERGIDIFASTVKTSGSGSISMIGDSSSPGIIIGPVTYDSGILLHGGATISSGAGPIYLEGTIRSASDDRKVGVWFYDNTSKVYSSTGDITIKGISAVNNLDNTIASTGTTYIGWDNGSNVTSGNIYIYGQDAGAHGGMDLSNIFVKSNGGRLTVGAAPFTAGVAGVSSSSGLGLGNFTIPNGFIVNGTILSGLTIGGVNDYGAITMNQVLGCANQAVTACASGVTMGTGSGGTGSNFVPAFVTIQAGGMYASGTNTIATPAALSAKSDGGNVRINSALTTWNGAINLYAGDGYGALPTSTATGNVWLLSDLTSNGGNITIKNSRFGATSGFMTGTGVGVELTSRTLDARGTTVGGNIDISGTSLLSGSLGNYVVGVSLGNTIIKTNNNGSLTVNGTSGTVRNNNNFTAGVYLGNSTLFTQNGDLKVEGTLRGNTPTGAGNYGAIFTDANQQNYVYTTGSGNISLIGHSTEFSLGSSFTQYSGSNTYIGWDNGSNVTTGNITIQGEGVGVFLSNQGTANFSVKSNGGDLIVGAAPKGSDGVTTGLGVNDITIGPAGTLAITIASGSVFRNVLIGDANTYGNVTINQAIGSSGNTVNGAIRIWSGGLYNGINQNSTTGNVLINQNLTTTSTGSDAIVLATGNNATSLAAQGTSDNVILAAGKTLTTGSGGRIVIYSGSISGTTSFSNYVPVGSGHFRYGRLYGDASLIPASNGAWLQYREQPTLTFTLQNNTKVYDGVALDISAYTADTNNYSTVTGFVAANGDTKAILDAAGVTGQIALDSAPYSNILHAGTYAATTGTLANNLGYAVVLNNANYTITPRPLTITSAGNLSKVYDGSVATVGTTAALSQANYQLGNFAVGDTGAIIDNISALYNSSHVVSANKVTSSGLSIRSGSIIGSGSSLASDYALSSSASSIVPVTSVDINATISPRPLTFTATGTMTKVYDGTTSVALSPANYVLGNFLDNGLGSADSGAIIDSTNTYDFAHVATASSVVVNNPVIRAGTITGTGSAGASPFGSLASDYALSSSAVSVMPVSAFYLPATITPRPVAISTGAQLSKTYDALSDVGSTTQTSGGVNLGIDYLYTLSAVSGNPDSGLVNGDSALKISHTSAIYQDSSNNAASHVDPGTHSAGQATHISVSGLSLTSVVNNNVASDVSDYYLVSTNGTPLTSGSTVNVDAKITPATVSLSDTTKLYDGSPLLTSGNVQVGNTINNETLATTGGQAGSPNVGTSYVVTSASDASCTPTCNIVTLVNGTGVNAGLATDYQLPASTNSSSNVVLISTNSSTPISLHATKVYDGSNDLTGYVVIVTPDGKVLSYTAATANSIHVGGGNFVSAITITDGPVGNPNRGFISNYVIPSVFDTMTAPVMITPRPVVISSNASALSKVYDGTMATQNTAAVVTNNYAYTQSALSGQLSSSSGLLSGDELLISNTSANYNTIHANQVNTYITANGFSINSMKTIANSNDPSLISDYQLVDANNSALSTLNLNATITPRALNVMSASSALTKVYDGTLNTIGTTAAIPSNYTYVFGAISGNADSGFIAGDSGAFLDHVSAAYNTTHANQANTHITVGGLSIRANSISGSGAGNTSAVGSLASDYALGDILTPINSLNLNAAITPRSISIATGAVSVSKIYDGTIDAIVPTNYVYSFDAIAGNTNTGFVNGDSSALVTVSSAVYRDSTNNAAMHVDTGAHATGQATHVFANGLSIASIVNSSNPSTASLASDYQLVDNANVLVNSVNINGGITPRPLVLTQNNGTSIAKVYDGTSNTGFNNASVQWNNGQMLSPAIFTLSNFAANTGDSANISIGNAVYNNVHVTGANAATQITLSNLSFNNFVAGSSSSSVASDYALSSSSASVVPLSNFVVAATITPRPLSVTQSSGVDIAKIYDGSSNTGFGDNATVQWVAGKALNATTGFTLGNFVAGSNDNANLIIGNASYDHTHVSGPNAASKIFLSNLNFGSFVAGNGSNSLASDYMIDSANAPSFVLASVTPRLLTVTQNSGVMISKVYDGTTATGFGDNATVAWNPGQALNGATAFTLGNFAQGSGDSADLQIGNASYNRTHVTGANAGTQISLSNLGFTNFNAGSSLASASMASDYQLDANHLPSAINASISARPLTLMTAVTGSTTKEYDGNVNKPIGTTVSVTGNTGGLAGDSFVLDLSNMSIAYNSSHVQTANTLQVSGTQILSVNSTNFASELSDYMPAAANASISASITPKQLTVLALGNLTKEYDGTTNTVNTTAFVNDQSHYDVSGFINGDSAASLNYSNALYDFSHVALAGQTASKVTINGLDIDAITGANHSLASDYSLNTHSIDVAATITPKQLIVIGVGNLSKEYDGTSNTLNTTAAINDQSHYSISGFAMGDSAASLAYNTALYDFAHVALTGQTASKVTVDGLSIVDVSGGHNSVASDYSLNTHSVDIAATVTPRTLTVSGLIAKDKNYDGDAIAVIVGSPVLANVIIGDDVALTGTASGLFDNKNVGKNKAVHLVGLGLSGTHKDDYLLSDNGTIPLTASITDTDLINQVLIDLYVNPVLPIDANLQGGGGVNAMWQPPTLLNQEKSYGFGLNLAPGYKIGEAVGGFTRGYAVGDMDMDIDPTVENVVGNFAPGFRLTSDVSDPGQSGMQDVTGLNANGQGSNSNNANGSNVWLPRLGLTQIIWAPTLMKNPDWVKAGRFTTRRLRNAQSKSY